MIRGKFSPRESSASSGVSFFVFFFSFLFFVFCFGLFLFRYMTLAAILFIFCAINATRPRRGDSNFEGKKTHPLFVSFFFFFFF